MIRKIKNIFHWLIAWLARLAYLFPGRQIKIIGVTGTDGKSTTTTLISHVLSEAGFKTAFISTVEGKIGNRTVEIGLHTTTPNSWQLNRLIRMAVKQGLDYLVLEVSSHALDQHRILGINFEAGVITNITHEHLDYHKTFQNYLQAKAKLFQSAQLAILNRDDDSYKFLKSKIKKAKLITYGIKNKADFTSRNFEFKTELPGEYNQYNCLAGIAVCASLGIDKKDIQKGVASFPGIKGRLEEIKSGQDFKVYVDYAHTPAAFQKVIPLVKKMIAGQLIHVFGCTGERDKSKRPIMGKVSGQLSDKIILTHEDTYREKPEEISLEVEKGVKKTDKVLNKDYWLIPDRQRAIQKAIEMAKKGDGVLITGVGHQKTLNINGREIPWSDQEEVKKAIRKRNA